MESSLWATMGKGIIIQALNHLGLKMQPILFGRISMQQCPNYMFGKIWEDPVGSRCHQFSPIWRTSKRPGPDPVLRATSLRSAPYGVFSVRESLPYDFSSPRDDPRRGGCREGIHFLNTWIFWCLPDVYIWKFHLLPILSCPVLSLQASSQYDSLSESQTHSHESSKCEKCPIWSFKHDKFRKKTINHYPWCILKVDVPLKHGSWMNQIVSNSFPPIILKYLP